MRYRTRDKTIAGMEAYDRLPRRLRDFLKDCVASWDAEEMEQLLAGLQETHSMSEARAIDTLIFNIEIREKNMALDL